MNERTAVEAEIGIGILKGVADSVSSTGPSTKTSPANA
jgi:hypothetical protein